MAAYVLRRTLYALPVILAVLIAVFLTIHLAPGDPVAMIVGEGARPEVMENVRRDLGLDRPIAQQFLDYAGRLARGDLGRSMLTRAPVAPTLLRAYTHTLEIVLFSTLLATLIAVPSGVVSALFHRSLIDRSVTVLTLAAYSFPSFWVGLMLMWLFSFHLGWLPISGRGGPPWTLEGLRHLLLPSLMLATVQFGALARLTRATMLETLGQDFVRTAHSKGLRYSRVVWFHVFRNAAIPILTVLGLQIGYFLGGVIVTETIFAYPGMGRAMLGAILQRDFPVLQGAVLFFAITIVLVNLVTDILYSVLDPRIRYS